MSGWPNSCDVLIIGAGPAGLSAARQLCEEGVASVHVIERETEPGGIPRHCAHSPYGWREYNCVMRGKSYAKALAKTATAAGAIIHTQTSVSALQSGPHVTLSTPAGLVEVHPKAVLIATGARETPRPPRFIGGTKPGGVINTGALQGLVHLEKIKPFKRPVIVGTEFVSFSALLTCVTAGMRPKAMIERTNAITARWPMRFAPIVFGVPLRFETEIEQIHGGRWVEGVTLRAGEKLYDVETDGVLLTGGFRPENALIRASHLALDPATLGPSVDQFGRCTDPHFFAAGNVLRTIETAGWCWAEGAAIAKAIAAQLRGELSLPKDKQKITIDGEGLRYVVPQWLADSDCPAALGALQMRAKTKLKAQMFIGRTQKYISTRPERRIVARLPDRRVPAIVRLEANS